MRVSETCAECLYERQKKRIPDEKYLAEVRRLIRERGESDPSPLLVYRFGRVREAMFGPSDSYAEVKKRYNDLVLGMEDALRERIGASQDPLRTALAFARVGNYIDYGAMDTVEETAFLELFEKACLRREEEKTYRHFLSDCEGAESFLLIADNCGEIVLDRLFLEQLKKRFPRLSIAVLVRGGEVLNDATVKDAEYAGLGGLAEILSNGAAVAGTVESLLPEDARRALDGSGVILAKGQGNYESLSGSGRHIYYAFLCKCALFTGRFGVPPLTGMLVEEAGCGAAPEK